MKALKAVVGIDVSKDHFMVCYKSRDSKVIKGTRSFNNNESGFSELLDWCSKRSDIKPDFVMEATGVYHEKLTDYLYKNGCQVSVVLANKIKHYAKSQNIKTKTDKSDASVIADYGLERNPAAWKPMTPKFFLLRQMCREMLSFKQDLTRAKNQRHALEYAYGISEQVLKVKDEQILFLNKSIRIMEEEICRVSQEDKAFDARVKLLTSIPGLRAITIITILCETDGFASFNNLRQVVSFAGLDISEKESGQMKGRSKISKTGNSHLRQCLYMPALSACSCNKPIKVLYERIVERNPTIKRKGIIAGMRKLLILVFVLWKKGEAYDPDFQWGKTKTSGNDETKSSYCSSSKSCL